jgi:hypothetical protein
MGTSDRRGTRMLVSLLALTTAALLHAQEPAKPTTTAQKPVATVPSATPATKVTPSTTDQLDTGESLSFLGRKLWFEVRRRMNLTTEEEESEQREREKDVRLKVGSISVKQPDPPAK